MKRVYGKTAMDILREIITEKSDQGIEIISTKDIHNVFREKYPEIKKSTVTCMIIRGTVNHGTRKHYNPKPEDDLLLGIGNRQLQILKEPWISEDDIECTVSEEEPEETREFAYEKDLQSFLARNLDLIEKGLQVYTDTEDEGVSGIEFPVGGRYIDILAKDFDDNFVVIELKVSRAYDRVVGQLLRYMAWIKENIAEDDQKVKGIIISRNITEDLVLATKMVEDIRLMEYQLEVSLSEVEK